MRLLQPPSTSRGFDPLRRALKGVLALAAVALLATGAAEPTGAAAASKPVALKVKPATAADIQAAAAAPGAKATLVNVWATFCIPCREEFPTLVQFQREEQAKGLRVMFVSADFDEQLPQVKAFLKHQGVSGTAWIKTGDDMKFINGLSPKWSGAIPFTLVYDGRGKLVQSWEGIADHAKLEAAVQAAMGSSEESQDSPPDSTTHSPRHSS